MPTSITKIIILMMLFLLFASTFGGLLFSVLKPWLGTKKASITRKILKDEDKEVFKI